MAKHETEFLKLVEAHERMWGEKHYRGRPSLASIMSAPVAVFWRSKRKSEERYKITTHETLDDVESYLKQLLFRAVVSPLPDTLTRIYVDKHRMHVTDIRIVFGVGDEG